VVRIVEVGLEVVGVGSAAVVGVFEVGVGDSVVVCLIEVGLRIGRELWM
jgi:hypothetical protein